MFNTTDAGSNAVGECLAGYSGGEPTLACNLDGTWASPVENACIRKHEPLNTHGLPSRRGRGSSRFRLPPKTNVTRGARPRPPARFLDAEITCAAFDDGTTTWASGVAGNPPTIIIGTCDAGYYVKSGSPYGGCDINGNFVDVENPCIGEDGSGRTHASGASVTV